MTRNVAYYMTIMTRNMLNNSKLDDKGSLLI